MKPSILIAVTDPELEKQLLTSSAIRQFKIVQVSGVKSWIKHLTEEPVDVVIAQVDVFTDEDLRQLTAYDNEILLGTDVLFVSSGEPNPSIEKAMLRGVAYHLRFPINVQYIKEIVTDLYEELAEDIDNSEAVTESDIDQFGLVVGSSPRMKRLYRVIRKAARSEASIFIIGESGSGKELVANTIHMISDRCDEPFISINCGAISPELIESELFGHIKGAFTGATNDRIGVFEQSDGGTLFLDEVTEMPIDHQVKLLRVLETGEYRKVGSSKTQTTDARIISATNREPGDAIVEATFREDLYYRLAQFPVRVPSLRDREGDIVGLAKHFLAYRNAEEKSAKEISADAIDKIKHHDWPGNVRELMHTIERAFILADDTITVDHLIIESMQNSTDVTAIPTNVPLDEIEKIAILSTLEANAGNKTETAEHLGISVKTLYNKIEKYGGTDDQQ